MVMKSCKSIWKATFSMISDQSCHFPSCVGGLFSSMVVSCNIDPLSQRDECQWSWKLCFGKKPTYTNQTDAPKASKSSAVCQLDTEFLQANGIATVFYRGQHLQKCRHQKMNQRRLLPLKLSQDGTLVCFIQYSWSL